MTLFSVSFALYETYKSEQLEKEVERLKEQVAKQAELTPTEKALYEAGVCRVIRGFIRCSR